MKYVKLIIPVETKDSFSLVECIDVPLSMLIPSRIVGNVDHSDIETVKAFDEESKSMALDVCSKKYKINIDVIYGFYVPIKKGAFNFIYDSVNRRREYVGNFRATSMAELILKLSVRGLVHSTDDDVCAVESKYELLGSENDRLKEELSEKNAVIARLEERCKLLEAASGDGQKKPRSRKSALGKLIDSIF